MYRKGVLENQNQKGALRCVERLDDWMIGDWVIEWLGDWVDKMPG